MTKCMECNSVFSQIRKLGHVCGDMCCTVHPIKAQSHYLIFMILIVHEFSFSFIL